MEARIGIRTRRAVAAEASVLPHYSCRLALLRAVVLSEGQDQRVSHRSIHMDVQIYVQLEQDVHARVPGMGEDYELKTQGGSGEPRYYESKKTEGYDAAHDGMEVKIRQEKAGATNGSEDKGYERGG